ncbi:MAG: hypothetical protein WBE26_10725 [Phycisphaerae bacterium]
MNEKLRKTGPEGKGPRAGSSALALQTKPLTAPPPPVAAAEAHDPARRFHATTWIAGLGPHVGIPFLEDILWAAGESITLEQLNGRLGSIPVSRNARDQMVATLHKAFGDSVSAKWYFIVKRQPWRIAWNVRRTWRVVEPWTNA